MTSCKNRGEISPSVEQFLPKAFFRANRGQKVTPEWPPGLNDDSWWIMRKQTSLISAFSDWPCSFKGTLLTGLTLMETLLSLFPVASTSEHMASVKRFVSLQFLNPKRVGRTPWMGDQPVERPLLTHRTTQTQNKCRQTSMPRVEFEPTIPVFEWNTTPWRRMGDWRYSSIILYLGTRWRWWSLSRPGRFALRKNPRCPLYRRLSATQSLSRRSGVEKNFLLLPVIEHRPSSPSPSLYWLSYPGSTWSS
jgi:hypothetical protein